MKEDQGAKKKGQAAGGRVDERNLDRPSDNFGGQRKKQIVVVDDELQIRDMIGVVLRFKGFGVLASLPDGADLVRLIDEMVPKPDVILLDERMPRMSGVEACRIVHARYPEIAIIFISADASARERGMKAGASAFLSKPISIQDLVSQIDSI